MTFTSHFDTICIHYYHEGMIIHMDKTTIESILKWDISTLANAYQKKEVSPVEIIKSLRNRIESIDSELNAFISLSLDRSLEEAQKAEIEISQGNILSPLHGVPICLKDLVYTKDSKTTMGSGVFKDFIPDFDATVVTKLKKAGAIIVGKTNTHELAYGPTGDDSYFGAIKNPHDVSKMAGGSSAGSAVAVSSFMSYAALGTDTSGSVRIPSSCCGIVGMKPTSGLVSKYGAYPLSWTMDHVGPMTRNVLDNAIVLQSITGFDKKDPYSRDIRSDDYRSLIGKSIKGCIIGIPHDSYYDYLDDEVKQGLSNAIEVLENLGAIVKEVQIPNIDDVLEACRRITRSEAYVINQDIVSHDLLSPQIRERILSGKDYMASDYIEAQQVRHKAIQQYDELLLGVDILVTPTLPILPANLGQEKLSIHDRQVDVRASLIRLTCPTNLNGFPSLSRPCGYSSTGLPIGLQLIGKRFDEINLYRYASAFEQANI
jgi:aspartyl-tRNA(Asn)/glutamyl-tRNA(Gln) amidotransferase subunit A